ncbi:MAG: uridine phosphorylase [Lachnospiraceae bacterium]|nr:uridine phosphorylase [Lachnospiraceae bacterium]
MEKMYHIGLDDSHKARYAILPGDPGRVEKIASYLENAHFLGQNREYTTWIGEILGEKVLVMSTGMGGPSTAIGVEELYQTGVRTMIRVGTCGGMAEKVMGGDLVIANGAIRMEGTSKEYVDIAFPAVADFEVTGALKKAAKDLGARFHLGVVQCKDSFYGQHDPGRMPCGRELEDKWEMWLKAGCLASEMESAALYIVAQVLGVRAGCVLNVVWNQERKKKGLSDPHCHDTSLAIRAAIRGVEVLIEEEQAGE